MKLLIIDLEAKKRLGLSKDEYLVGASIHALCQSPKFDYWCKQSRQDMANHVEVGLSTLYRHIKKLVDEKLIVKNSSGHLRTTQAWYDVHNSEEKEAGEPLKSRGREKRPTSQIENPTSQIESLEESVPYRVKENKKENLLGNSEVEEVKKKGEKKPDEFVPPTMQELVNYIQVWGQKNKFNLDSERLAKAIVNHHVDDDGVWWVRQGNKKVPAKSWRRIIGTWVLPNPDKWTAKGPRKGPNPNDLDLLQGFTQGIGLESKRRWESGEEGDI